MGDEIVITGRVLDRRERAPLVGAAVEARLNAAGGKSRAFKRATATDDAGAFRFTTSEKEWAHKGKDAFVSFRLTFGDPRQTIDTRESRRWLPPGSPAPLEIYVDLEPPRRLSGTVVERDDAPASDRFVVARVRETGLVLGWASTDAAGHYAIQAAGAPGKSPDLEVVVYDDATARRELKRAVAKAVGAKPRTVNLRLPAPADTLTALNAALGRPISGELVGALAEKGVRTLSQLRAAGGVPRALVAPGDALYADAERVNRIAVLSLIGAPVGDLAAIADAGVDSLAEFAHLPYDELRRRVGKQVRTDVLERYWHMAFDAFIDVSDRIIEKRLDHGAPGDIGPGFDELFRLTCDCDCSAATALSAYLAHVLRFSTRVLRYGGAPVDIAFLQDRLVQPLRDLPATCESESELARARIAVEILRKDLAALGNAATANASPEWYTQAAYLELLEYLDIEYDELRRLSLRAPRARARFAYEKGLGDDPADSQIFDELYWDVAAPAGSGREPTEAWLESYFGLRSTLADPLRPDLPDTTVLDLRGASLRAEWVALDASTRRPMGRVPLIDPDLVGELDLVDRTPRAPNDDIPSWRPIDFLARRRAELVSANAAIASNLGPDHLIPTAQQYKDLFLDLTTRQGNLAGSAIPVPPYGFSAAGQSLDYPRLKQLRDDADAGVNVAADLALFEISEDDVRELVHLVEVLESGLPVTADESQRARHIILAHIKRAGFWPVWLAQERVNALDPNGQRLALEPSAFRRRTRGGLAPDPAWQASPPLSELPERLAWEDVLRARVSAVDALRADLTRRVVALEGRLLPELRNELIRFTGPGLVTMQAKVDALIDRHQLDFAAGGCQRTSRVSQAAESVLGLLFGARNGLLDDAQWTVVPTDFDVTWRWLGTYEVWSRAILAYLFPERLTRPAWLTRPSPGLADAFARLRAAEPVGATEAAAVYQRYAAYVNDVASLELVCGAELELAGERTTVVLAETVGRDARRLYWSIAIDRADDTGDQGWWRTVDAMAGVDAVVGCARCGRFVVALTTSMVAASRGLELWRLPLPAADAAEGSVLDHAAEWEGPFALELPDGVNSFLSASIAHGAGVPVVTIEVDEARTYTRLVGEDARSWTGRFRFSQPAPLWRRFRESTAYGVSPANDATFACHGDGLVYSVPDAACVLAADVDRDGADELIAFGGADGFWALEMVMVGPRAAWLPLGGQPLTRRYDVTLTKPSQRLFFTVSGDFDGNGVAEVAALTEADPPPRTSLGGPATTYMNLFVRRWLPAQRAWTDLGDRRDPGANAQLFITADRLDPRACVVGRFTQTQRDEILIAYHDATSAGDVTDVEVYGLVGGAWQLVVSSTITDMAGRQPPLTGGRLCAGRFVPGGVDQLVMQQVGAAGLSTGRFWTFEFRAGAWRRLTDLDANAISGRPRLLAADFDADGIDELVCADNTNSIRIFKQQANAWSFLHDVQVPGAVEYWTAGDFENTGTHFVIAKCANSPTAGVVARGEALAPGAVEQEPDLTLGSTIPARAVVSGRFAGALEPTTLAALGTGCTFYVQAKAKREVTTSRLALTRFKPYFPRPYRLNHAGSSFALLDSSEIAAASREAFEDNRDNRPRNQEYLEEGFYFLIVEIALRLQTAGNLPAALDWLQLVARLAGSTLLEGSHFLALSARGALAPTTRGEFDPLDGHAVARRRAGTYNRYTRLTFIRLLADYGEAQHALGLPPALGFARELYKTALALLDGLASVFEPGGCEREIAALIDEVGAAPGLASLIPDLRALSRIEDVLALNEAIATIRGILAGGDPPEAKRTAVQDALDAATAPAVPPTIGDRVVEEYTIETAAHATVLPGTESRFRSDGRDDLWYSRPDQAATSLPQYSFCIPAQTQQLELRRRIELALFRIANCLDVAGNELAVTAGAAVTQTLPYPYETLIDRAKHLLEVARQFEASSLSFIESAERKRYEVQNARRDLAVANVTERLRAVQVEQAVQERGSAGLQRDRAQDQVDKWSQLLRDGLTEWEIAAAAAQWISFGLKQSAAIATTVKYAASAEGWVSDVISFGTDASAAISNAVADASSAFATAAHTQADYERRAQGWAQNLRDSLRDVQIGNQSIVVQNTRVEGAQIEQQIAGLQTAFAEELVTTLTARNVANEALYEAAATVYQGVYRYLLLQATQLARAAEARLSLVRGEPMQGLIKASYRNVVRAGESPDVNSVSNSTDALHDLTGAANLLRDIYQLDQLAFSRNRRKHQLTETLSLVQHDPLGFAQLASTGRMAFDTPIELVQSRLPSVYLCLIRRVRLTVIALVPPSAGVRAVLSNAGVSRVVIPDGDGFTTTTLRRGYEEMIVTSPVNGGGVFEVDAQPGLRGTFEDVGFDTRWFLELAPAANLYDPASLADVQVSIDYTALSSSLLRDRVIASLPERREAARVFSLRNEFQDVWYELCNPRDPNASVDAGIEVRRSDFPANLRDLRVRHIAVSVRFRGGVTPFDIDDLEFTAAAAGAPIDGGPAQLDGAGIVSTRFANGAGWRAVVTGAAMVEPMGVWRLRFASSALPSFADDGIEDVLFTLAFDGLVPPWP